MPTDPAGLVSQLEGARGTKLDPVILVRVRRSLHRGDRQSYQAHERGNDHAHSDHSAIEIVVLFYTADDEIAAVKSDLIKAVHTAFDAMPEKPPHLEHTQRTRPIVALVEAVHLSS